jgi:hypothetical protein
LTDYDFYVARPMLGRPITVIPHDTPETAEAWRVVIGSGTNHNTQRITFRRGEAYALLAALSAALADRGDDVPTGWRTAAVRARTDFATPLSEVLARGDENAGSEVTR